MLTPNRCVENVHVQLLVKVIPFDLQVEKRCFKKKDVSNFHINVTVMSQNDVQSFFT